jgi:enamine deaminase RidA (YjgF/YER057c/UK114 family)
VPVELLNPDGLPKPEVYRQVAVASGSRLVFLAGQVGETRTVEQSAPGTSPRRPSRPTSTWRPPSPPSVGFDDVAKITLYVTDWSNAKLPALGAGVARAAAKLDADLTKPVTLLPVAALGEPDLLIEVDATAVLP